MGAAWLVIVLLNLNIGHSTSLASAMPAAKIPPPQIILASLRENRRELLEMIQPRRIARSPAGKIVSVTTAKRTAGRNPDGLIRNEPELDNPKPCGPEPVWPGAGCCG